MSDLYSIEIVDESWEDFDKVLRLDYEVLYGPCGVAQDADWYHGGVPSVHAVALSGRRLFGSARLLGSPGDPVRQVRQVVVEPAMRRLGIGRALVEALERQAAQEGCSEIVLNAREAAYPFYAGLGYEFASETFVSELTHLPHRAMRKILGGS